jgi:hypothetical protein
MPLSVRFDVAPGVTLEASWTTPATAEVRLVDPAGSWPLVERWSMIGRKSGMPLIEESEAALAQLAEYRLSRHRGAAELLALIAVRGLVDSAGEYSQNIAVAVA